MTRLPRSEPTTIQEATAWLANNSQAVLVVYWCTSPNGFDALSLQRYNVSALLNCRSGKISPSNIFLRRKTFGKVVNRNRYIGIEIYSCNTITFQESLSPFCLLWAKQVSTSMVCSNALWHAATITHGHRPLVRKRKLHFDEVTPSLHQAFPSNQTFLKTVGYPTTT